MEHNTADSRRESFPQYTSSLHLGPALGPCVSSFSTFSAEVTVVVVATRDLTRQSGGALGHVEMIMMVVAMVDVHIIMASLPCHPWVCYYRRYPPRGHLSPSSLFLLWLETSRAKHVSSPPFVRRSFGPAFVANLVVPSRYRWNYI